MEDKTATAATTKTPTKPLEVEKDSTTPPKDAPGYLRAWHSLYVAIPRIYFPGTQMDISNILVGTAFLMTVRFTFQFTVIYIFGWPATAFETKDAAGCAAAFTHAMFLCPGLVCAFLTHKYSPSEHHNMAPKWWIQFVDAMLQFCTGYMVYDAIFIVILRITPGYLLPQIEPGDWLFLGHHMVTTIYMTQTRYYQAGHMSAMMCMLLGELTNPFQNSWMISDYATAVGLGNAKIHFVLETMFAAAYFSMRTLIAPVIFIHMSYDLLFSKNARANLPIGVRIFWCSMIWGVVFGSSSWVAKCYNMLQVNLGFVAPEVVDAASEEL